ncbi:ATP-binding protein [Nonomuraea sp. NPDC050451]|uniref:ATP-binding protein n=1 Tax=Nonomuraea sp. NPDC050451 TaxID=3364364 RepID=UPI0037A9AF88
MTAESYVRFFPDALAVPRARQHVEKELRTWGLANLVDDDVLVVSELVTNSVTETVRWMRERECGVAGEGEDALIEAVFGRWSWPWTIAFAVYRFGSGAVVVEAWDCSRKPPIPVPKTDDWTLQGGRGLHIVDEVSKRWGYRWPRSGGKVVYAVLGRAER